MTNFEDLQPGDIGAYAMGRYANPSDESRPKHRDTGHVFVVVGPPAVVDPTTQGYDGRGTLREEATKVIAVPVVDSSSIVHFDPDSRKNGEGRYSLPKVRPHSRAGAGGVGTGTIWFALSKEGHVLQRRLGPQQKYRAVLARAARLRGRISLDEPILGSRRIHGTTVEETYVVEATRQPSLSGSVAHSAARPVESHWMLAPATARALTGAARTSLVLT